MKDQHEKIKGYRDLTQSEIDAMNSVKAFEADGAALLRQLSEIPGINGRDLRLGQIAVALDLLVLVLHCTVTPFRVLQVSTASA